jgi:outer membrane assembly lipoprotein YfiO
MLFSRLIPGVPSLVAAMMMGLILLAGCAETMKELQADDSVLLDKANNFYARTRFNQAAGSYRKLVEGYPDSNYRKAGLIGLADSLYKEGQFDEASLHYERLVELYPMDDLTPRALFYSGMSHMMLTSNLERNQAKTKTSMRIFGEFITRYPDHQLAPSAGWYKKEMARMLAGSKLEIARFYHRTGKSASAIGRLKEYIEENPKAPEAPEAMFMMGDSYMREQAYRQAAEVFTVLIGAHPESQWAQKARAAAGKLALKAE